MSKNHFYRRAGVIHISPEAETAFGFIAAWPCDLRELGVQLVWLQRVLDNPSPKISQPALAGIATSIDIVRLMVTVIPSESEPEFRIKQMVLEDREPLMQTSTLLPLLVSASLVSDEYRLGLRSHDRIVR